MRKPLALLALLCAVTLTCRATTVDYNLSVINAPGGIGSFSWEIQTQGFVVETPPIFDSQGDCLNCSRYNFTPIASSAPSNGQGCGISGVFMEPDYAITTFFSPLCDGLYDSTSAGDLPDPPDQLGTFSQQWVNQDGSINYVSLTITDPAGPVNTPEPSTLLLFTAGLAWLGWRRLGRIGEQA